MSLYGTRDAAANWEDAYAKVLREHLKNGTGVVSDKNGKARTDRLIGAHQRGKARGAQRAAAKAAYTALTKLVTLIGGRNQTGHSTQSERRNSLLHVEREQSAESTT